MIGPGCSKKLEPIKVSTLCQWICLWIRDYIKNSGSFQLCWAFISFSWVRAWSLLVSQCCVWCLGPFRCYLCLCTASGSARDMQRAVRLFVLLKPGSENFEHYFTSVWDECNCAVVWAFFRIAFLWDWNENWPFPVPWPLLSFPNLLTYWVQHFHSIIFQDLK